MQPGRWDSSVGGHLGVGEDHEEAALREAAEEIGIALLPDDLVFVHRYLWRTDVETELVATYRVTHEGPFVIDPGELDAVRFFGPEELAGARGSGLLTPNLEFELGEMDEGGIPPPDGTRRSGSGLGA